MDITKQVNSFFARGFRSKASFTLIELLIVIAIISILIGVLVPNISRSLSGNRLASDVGVLRAKIEETRLLAGSTQTNDEMIGNELPATDRTGYYAVLIPSAQLLGGANPNYYALVRLSRPLNQNKTEQGYCGDVREVINQTVKGVGHCLVERVNLTKEVSFYVTDGRNDRHRFIAFRAPSQQVVEIYCHDEYCDNALENIEPKFDKGVVNGNYFELSYRDKTAAITIEPYTGKLTVLYK